MDSNSAQAPLAIVAGASGFIGTSLLGPLQEWGYRVVTVGRSRPKQPNPGVDASAHTRTGSDSDNGVAGHRSENSRKRDHEHISWTDAGHLGEVIDGADLLLNFAGRSVGCRYHDRNRQEIWDSRIDTTFLLREAVERANQPPRLWINASTATIYRHAMDRPQSESDGQIGEGFSVDVATGWEREFFYGELPGTRRVAARMAIVLGDGSALTMLARVARLGAGGPQLEGRWLGHRRYRGIGPQASGPDIWRGHPLTHGRQRFSWIHIDDVIRAIRFIDTHEDMIGPINFSSPGVSDNRILMQALRRAVHMPIGIPAPRWLLEIGMTVLQQESELVLKSRWVVPERLHQAGFDFRWTDVHAAIRQILS